MNELIPYYKILGREIAHIALIGLWKMSKRELILLAILRNAVCSQNLGEIICATGVIKLMGYFNGEPLLCLVIWIEQQF